MAQRCDAIVAPEICYAAAQFNMSFPGPVSLNPKVYNCFVSNILKSLSKHGRERIYILNGHGGNLEILRHILDSMGQIIQIASRWDF